jgi:hypothetical protein
VQKLHHLQESISLSNLNTTMAESQKPSNNDVGPKNPEARKIWQVDTAFRDCVKWELIHFCKDAILIYDPSK